MLRAAGEEELTALIDCFWPVALDLTHSTYPTYTDGVKTQADFVADVRRSWQADWGEVLVHVAHGAVNGLVVIDEVDDEYVSLRVCLTIDHQQTCLKEALAHIACRHPGKTLWLGLRRRMRICWPLPGRRAFHCWRNRSTGTSP